MYIVSKEQPRNLDQLNQGVELSTEIIDQIIHRQNIINEANDVYYRRFRLGFLFLIPGLAGIVLIFLAFTQNQPKTMGTPGIILTLIAAASYLFWIIKSYNKTERTLFLTESLKPKILENSVEWLIETFRLDLLPETAQEENFSDFIFSTTAAVNIYDKGWKIHTLQKEGHTIYFHKTIDYDAEQLVTIHKGNILQNDESLSFIKNKSVRNSLIKKKEKLVNHISYLDKVTLSVENEHVLETLKQEISVFEKTLRNLKQFNVKTYSIEDITEILDTLNTTAKSLVEEHHETITSELKRQNDWLKESRLTSSGGYSLLNF